MGDDEEARAALHGLVLAARGGDLDARRTGLAYLAALSGHGWLTLDGTARRSGWGDAVVTGGGWTDRRIADASGVLIPVVASWHVDGRVRQRTVQRLTEHPGRMSAAALAVRCTDHVVQVRQEALQALLLQVGGDVVDLVVAVLSAGSARTDARSVLLAYTDRALAAPGGADVLLRLTAHRDRDVARWAVATALRIGLLSAEDVIELARTHSDQLVRRWSSEYLASEWPEVLARLLDVPFVEARLTALERFPDHAITDARLIRALLDRSPRIRSVAQRRSRGRGWDVAGIYRAQLSDGEPERWAIALAGLAVVGADDDVPSVTRLLGHERSAVRASAASALVELDAAERVIPHLAPMLLDTSPRVVVAAARALVKAGAGVEVAEAAWASEQVASRRAAWRIQRAARGWDRAEADLRAAGDQDAGLAENGAVGVNDWLRVGAAGTWRLPSPAQRASLTAFLSSSGVTEGVRQQVAFHAGLGAGPPPHALGSEAGPVENAHGSSRRSWIRALRTWTDRLRAR
jgi:hypothetical protein